MSTVTLAQAERIIDAAIARGVELNCRPISVIVVEPGCKVKAFKKEDGASMIRFEMAFGKAYAALSLGRSSKLVRERAEEKPTFALSRLPRATISFSPKAAACSSATITVKSSARSVSPAIPKTATRSLPFTASMRQG